MVEEPEVTILRVAEDVAKGYLRAVNPFSTKEQRSLAIACHDTARNTAWFILREMGCSYDDVQKLKVRAGIASPPTEES